MTPAEVVKQVALWAGTRVRMQHLRTKMDEPGTPDLEKLKIAETLIENHLAPHRRPQALLQWVKDAIAEADAFDSGDAAER